MSNPIQSQDLYQPGAQDTIASLQKQLVQLQNEMKGIVGLARQMKTALAGTQGIGGKEKITDFASQTEKLRQQQERTKQAYARTQITLQRLIVTQNQAAASANRVAISQSQAAAAALRLETANKRAETATKRHSGSLTGLVGSIRNLAYAYFSLGAAAQVFQNILKQTKALDTLTVAFNTTLGSTQATAQAQEYLLDISERFGANLLGASQAYLKFSAASTQAGVSAEETQKIFTSVTKASSILGLGAERTSYVFLALEQIMSKGRLSTEELRRQLGEHLPGAFGIAAEAMGVTTAKLTDMLKKGEIASTDFLPKFAKQLELAYGIDQVERIDNLAAAQERFNNQLTLLIKELDLSDAFKALFNGLADLVRVFAENAEALIFLGKAVVYVTGAWLAYIIPVKGAAVATRLLVAAQVALNGVMRLNPFGLAIVAAYLLITALDKLRTKTDQTTNSLTDLEKRQKDIETNAISANRALNAQAEALKKGNLPLEARKKIIGELNKELAPYLDKLLTEESSYSDIKAAVDKANQSLATRINLLKIEDEYVAGREEELKIADELATLAVEIAQHEANTAAEKAKYEKDAQDGNKIKLDQGIDVVKSIQEQQAATEEYNKKIARKIELDTRLVELQEAYTKAGGKDINSLIKSVTPSNDDEGDTKSKGKDPRLEELNRLEGLNKLLEDSLDKRVAAVVLAYQKEKVIHEGDTEYIIALREQFGRDLVEVDKKWQDEQREGFEGSRAKLEGIQADIAKSFADFYRNLIAGDAQNIDAFNKAKEAAQGVVDEVKAIFNGISESQQQDREEADIFSLLGINFKDDAAKEEVVDALDFAKQQLTDFLDFQKEIIDQEIENADRKVAAAENNLQRQIALQVAGQANNVAGAQADLALAKKTQEDALKQRQKFQKTELALNTALEASNLGVAIAKTLAALPGPGGIALVALMLGAFAAAKIKAFQLVNKKTFRKGGFEMIGGGSHESGKDTHVGGGNYAEKDESVGIFTAKATRKYKPTLKALVNAANKGTLENILIQDRRAIQGINMINKTDIDTSLMEKRLTRLVSLNETKTFVDGRGRLVRMDRGRTTVINK